MKTDHEKWFDVMKTDHIKWFDILWKTDHKVVSYMKIGHIMCFVIL